MPFLHSFFENVRKYPEKIALEFIDPPLQQITYAGLDQLVGHTAATCKAWGYSPATGWRCSFLNLWSSSCYIWQLCDWEPSPCRSTWPIHLMS